MRQAFMSFVAPLALVAACSENGASQAPGPAAGSESSATTPVAAANTPAAAARAIVALGLTEDQLGDADILDASGIEIAEVERVITDSSGTVTGLLVEIEDTDPDRYVTVPLEGLAVVHDGDDQNLRGNLTRQQLLAMPAASR